MTWRPLTIWIAILTGTLPAAAQQIQLADNTPLPGEFCFGDTAVEIKADITGGVFSGCGVFQEHGKWYFNPSEAVKGVTVFPYSCNISYTTQHTVNKRVVIHKPVIIEPALQAQGTCDGAFSLTATTRYAGSYQYTWEPAPLLKEPGQATTAGQISETTTFYLTAIDNVSGCAGSDSVVITKYPIPQLTVSTTDTTIIARENIQLQASGADSYQWIPGKWLSDNHTATPTAYPRASVGYTVIGRNEFGCYDSAHVNIRTINQYFIPGAFTPNGDGLNDVFKIENIGYQGIGAFQIFDRWGQLVFEGNEATAQWDGTFKGQPAPSGTYYYYIILNDINGESNIHKGDLTLVR